MVVYQGHPILELEIDGKHAEIEWEQKPLLFINGFIFIGPEEFWSTQVPTIEFSVEGGPPLKLTSFIRSKPLVSIIIEIGNTIDIDAFNKKWAGKIIDEVLDQVTQFDAIDQVDKFTI